MSTAFEYNPGPLHDFVEYPKELLDQIRLGAWMANDIETLEIISDECRDRDALIGPDDNSYWQMFEYTRHDIKEIQGDLISPSTSYDELKGIYFWASILKNAYRLEAIEAEARKRDGGDDTDARYFYLAEQCGASLVLLADAAEEGEIYGKRT